MARGAPGHRAAVWYRVLLPLVVVAAAVLVLPATALATGGTSDWPAPGGSSTWTSPEPEAPGPDPLPEPVTPQSPTETPVEPEAEPALLVAVNGIAFPVAGNASYTADFGAPRPEGRTHKGIDIFAEKMTPVVAAADGTVGFVRNTIGSDCCLVKIRHNDGRASLYLHLNNDTPGTDDGLGYGLAEGIAVGVRVTAGTVIGYVGDSGNAEDTPSHLHFELHDANGTAVDPYPYLQIAEGAEPALFASVLLAQPETLPETGLPFGTLALLSMALIATGTLLSGRTSPRR